MTELARARSVHDGLLAPRRRCVVLLSGGRDSTCLLDLAVRIAGAGAVSALHVNYGLRERGRATMSAAAGAVRATRRFRSRCVERAGPRPAGNLQAWARDARYGAARERARAGAADVAAGHTATDQVETILYRLASSPSRRALLGMRAAGGLADPAAARVHPRADRRLLPRAGPGLARGREQRLGRVRARAGRGRGWCPALREIHPAAEQNVLALAEVLRERGGGARRAGRRERSAAATQIELDARCASCRPRCAALVVQRLADGAAGAPGARHRPAADGDCRPSATTPRSTFRTACAPRSDGERCGSSDATGTFRPPGQSPKARASAPIN